MSHGYLGDPGDSKGSFGPGYNWKCPRFGCRFEITSWTDTGLFRLKEPHINKHFLEDKETLEIFQSKLISAPVRDYNKFRLTWNDVTFLWTRGIRVDEADYDKTTTATPNNETDRNQVEWGKILDAVIRRTKDGTSK